MVDTEERAPWLPPRWFIHVAWRVHRALFRATGGRRGLWPPEGGRFGTMRVTTVGRRSGQDRSVILGYLEDGPNLVTLAMNGWQPEEPAWWLNLQANPRARVQVSGATLDVVAHAAVGEERSRLWARWTEVNGKLEGYARRRPGETAVVVLAPVSG